MFIINSADRPNFWDDNEGIVSSAKISGATTSYTSESQCNKPMCLRPSLFISHTSSSALLTENTEGEKERRLQSGQLKTGF
jgi:hypothetical protein